MEYLGDVRALGTLSDEPSQALILDILQPNELLRALGWPGSADEIGLPIPVDEHGLVDPAAARRVVVIAEPDPLPLRHTLCSILERAGESVAVTVALPAKAGSALEELLSRLKRVIPGLEPAEHGSVGARPEALELRAGESLPWDWRNPGPPGTPPAVAYLLPGVPEEGSGGVNSVVQEARGLRALGAQTRVCLPAGALERASRLYGNEDQIFVSYARETDLGAAVGGADVVVATEHSSVRLLSRLVNASDLDAAYYVQDYEPLFAQLGSARSDRALLSYGALPAATLFAKTHFLRNVVSALHRVRVMKVVPSLDRLVFHEGDGGRPDPGNRALTVLAMVRPRTPRRRPRATTAALGQIEAALGEAVRIITFGCDYAELEATEYPRTGHHLGRLTTRQVADQLRASDVFIDCSAYQAFGRSGLEAMACGAVPLLPALGGTSEYAVDGENAILVTDDAPRTFADAVVDLARDRDRLAHIRARGISRAREFSVERAAASQLEIFGHLHALRKRSSRSATN